MVFRIPAAIALRHFIPDFGCLGGLITGGSYGDLYLCARCGYTQVFFPVREDPAQLASRASLDNATAIRELLEANRELGEEDENPSR